MICEEGMSIITRSEGLFQIRRDLIDLFVSDHPLRCVTCDKSGACALQNYAYEHGVSDTTYDFELSRELLQDDNPMFLRDHQYCILCGRCVSVCDQIVGANAIDFSKRGFESQIATPFDAPMAESSCVFCGNCVQVCPTSALMPKSRMGRGREWELERKRTICGYCGVGCSVEYALKDGEIIYAQGYQEAPVNGEFLCVKGRFGWDFVNEPDRLTQPLVRRDLAFELGLCDQPWSMPEGSPLKVRDYASSFIPVSWDRAVDIVTSKIAETVKQYGGNAVAGLTSARCTNEDNYLFQKLMRASIGTNNVDHCARL
jgi:predicted molibdopterin-dependent oxidoreductase YjgC